MAQAAVALHAEQTKMRQAAFSESHSVLTDIYHDQVNLAVWQNPLCKATKNEIQQLLTEVTHLKAVMTVTPENVGKSIAEHTPALQNKIAFQDYISTLVDMYCTLFELKRVGLRLSLLTQAMCPKFHVDRVPCRLITTFSGIATEWLPHHKVDRSKLGAGSLGMSDATSGIMQSSADIEQLATGDVALVKGETWYNNKNAGLVHRSPFLANGERRLILTLDFIE